MNLLHPQPLGCTYIDTRSTQYTCYVYMSGYLKTEYFQNENRNPIVSATDCNLYFQHAPLRSPAPNPTHRHTQQKVNRWGM